MKKLPDPDGSIKQNVFQARQWEKQGWRYFQGVPDEVLEENWYITHIAVQPALVFYCLRTKKSHYF